MPAKANSRKKGGVKGQLKPESDSDNPDLNPLLHVENKDGFSITTSNLLMYPDALIYDGYENFNVKVKEDNDIRFDYTRFDENTEIIIVLRYYEYICTAEMRVDYIMPLLNSGLNIKQIFAMVCHCLKNKLLCNVPSFDTVFEPDIIYIGKIKYNQK
jgi:hypothetical protein